MKKKPRKTFAELALTEPYLKAIGLVVAEWAWAEQAVERVIWGLLGLEKMGAAVTTHMSSEVRLNIVETIIRDLLREKGKEKVLSKVLKDMATFRKLRIERNNIVHAVWARAEPEDSNKLPTGKKKLKRTYAYRKKAKGQFIRTLTPYKPAQIRRTAKGIAKLSFALIADSMTLSHWLSKRREPAATSANPHDPKTTVH